MDSASETLRWIREANDPEERNARINEVVQNGPDAARRALFDPNLPPQAAGFPSADYRERKRREALQAADPEAYETAKAVRSAVSTILDDVEGYEKAQHDVRQAALAAFDKFTRDRS